MKLSANSSSNLAFALLLAFLFLINFSIAGCYIFLTLILLLFILYLARGGEFPRPPFFCYFFAAYIFFTMLATVFSFDRAASIRDNKELLIFLLIPIYLWLLNTWKRVWLSIWTILASGVFSALVGIYTVWHKGIVLSDRLKGFTSHWMTYAGLLMFAFIFFFVLMLLGKNKKQSLIISGALAVMLIAIVFSLTRSAWLGIAGALLMFLIFFRPKYFLALAPLALILALLAPLAVKNRILSIVDLHDKSNLDRIHMVYSGFKIFQDHPWTGVGSNNIEKVIAGNEKRYRHPLAEKINPHLHNNFLQIMAERGIFALASFLLACLFIILQLLKLLKARTGDWRAITAAVFFAFIGFLIAGMFEYNFGDSEIKFILFYFISLPFLNLKEEAHVQFKENR
ncbi:MAG: O-antigen ligase family protein [Candidatus Aminicenantes bacterium]|nr:O-antigen ligase family protein [Candidatus Aminicenantes bacterium]